MSPEQMRIAIAIECEVDYPEWAKKAGLLDWWKDEIGGEYAELPNYPESRDACAEFEDKITEDEWHIYVRHLSDFPKTKHGVRATALQRCEAFLRMKGKWV